jgi:phosphatidylinositol alpha-1,6-mannosyltransferase
MVAAARRIPWIAIEHGWRPSRWLIPAKRAALGRANAVVAVSDYSGRCLTAMGVRPRRLETIRNGADARLFRVLEPSRRGAALRRLSVDRARILVTVGTVSVRKAQDVVIRALPRVLRTHPDALYAMAGLDFAAPQFMGIARELGVADRVRILGPVEDAELVELLNDAELAILTSRHVPEGFEGFGIAVMEAALCALPAIVAGDSGLAEAVADGETGIVVPPEDVEATAQAILTLMGDGSLRARMGARARERALREYTWEVVTAKYDRLLRSVLEGEAK